MKTPTPEDLTTAYEWLRHSCKGEDAETCKRVAEWLRLQACRQTTKAERKTRSSGPATYGPPSHANDSLTKALQEETKRERLSRSMLTLQDVASFAEPPKPEAQH